jgi:hypothetical protein
VRVTRRRCLVATLVAAAACALVPSVASAKLTAKTSIVVKDGAARIVVALSTTTTLKAAQKPKTAKVKIAGKTWALTKVAGTPRTFRSTKVTPPAKLLALAGKKALVKVTTAGGKKLALASTVTSAAAGGGTTTAPGTTPAAPGSGTGTGTGTGEGGSVTLFDPPGRELSTQDDATKQAASDFLLKYFANSTFTTCTARWPNCAVEEFYDHCASGAWHYARLTPTSGSDIRAYGTISVVGAVVHADGSWIVRYAQASNGGTPSLYEWAIDTRGVATGVYEYPAGSGQISNLGGPFTWTQPIGPDPYTGEHTCA